MTDREAVRVPSLLPIATESALDAIIILTAPVGTIIAEAVVLRAPRSSSNECWST